MFEIKVSPTAYKDMREIKNYIERLFENSV